MNFYSSKFRVEILLIFLNSPWAASLQSLEGVSEILFHLTFARVQSRTPRRNGLLHIVEANVFSCDRNLASITLIPPAIAIIARFQRCNFARVKCQIFALSARIKIVCANDDSAGGFLGHPVLGHPVLGHPVLGH